jgi:uncharacterized protein
MNEVLKAVNNKKLFRFEIPFENGEFATLDYRWLKGSMVLMHTVVPKDKRRQGIGAVLVTQVLDHARAHGLKVRAYCPFVSEFMKKHPEYNDLLETVS